MQKDTLQKATRLLIRNRRRHIWRKIVSALACVVVFCTTYALILPAITLEKTPDCYETISELPVDSAESVSIDESAEKECFADSTADVETAEDWEQTFASAELTGIWAEDVLAIAESQIGYTESTVNYMVEPDGLIRKGYTRYGAWYGNPYGDWCAMFVSFCLNYAGIPEKAFAREESCSLWVEALENQNLYIPAGEDYQPEAGDVVFFDTDGDGLANHAGLVCELRCEEENAEMITGFTTIEGDRDNQVLRQEYTSDDASIVGYGVLPEPNEEADTQEETAQTETLQEPAIQEEAAQTEVLQESAIQEEAAQTEVLQESAIQEEAAQAADIQEEVSQEEGDWGYRADGSIYWNTVTFTEIAADAIQTGTPYIIAGNSRKNVMTSTPKVDGGETLLTAVRPESNYAYTAYVMWYFEQADGGYRIYTNNGGSKKYLKLETVKLSLADTESDASIFTVTQSTCENYTDRAAIRVGEYYINAYAGDIDSCRGFGGWNVLDAGSSLKIMVPAVEKNTAGPKEYAASTNTVLNLFDYWSNPDGQAARDDRLDEKGQFLNDGINSGHNFKFYKKDGYTDGGTMNTLQSHAVITKGIVKNTLTDGYPSFSGDESVTGGSEESLDYLFDPKKTGVEGREVYPNVGGLLRVNEEGYYFFDSQETMAEFDKDKKSILIYDKPGVKKGGTGTVNEYGQFFPMNKAPQIMEAKSTDSVMNHYFGITLTTRFIQRYGGYTDMQHNKSTTFTFKGDDDVWIFIDGVLVADLGGAHASVGVDIDFSTGNITTSYSDWNGNPQTAVANLRNMYDAAGAAGKTNWNGNTFADNTTHTLKFFYLERGNWDSNLYLKYNLTEIPETAIYKVDQYNDKVEGATFVVYAANKNEENQNYQMLSDKGGEPVTITGEPQYDGNGNIVDGDDKVLAKALYKGTTNEQGEMIFVDPDGMPYSLLELEDLFGTHFILREIEVPEGYRLVSEDVNLQIWRGANQRILKCDNTMESGSRAAATLQITATDKLHLQKPYNGNYIVDYCDEEGKSEGTLFAVVFKYTGAIDENGNAAGVNTDGNWAPVYGNDAEGYSLVDMTGKTLLEGVLEAVKEARKYGNVEFKLSPSSTMQLTLENLPGHITTYYRMLNEEQKGQTRYTVAYYWTPGSLDEATKDNLYRVYTFAEATGDGISYSAFDRIFGANIHVPNLINEVLVQKMDENGDRIDGATFALYQVAQQSNGDIYYRTESGDYVPLGQDAKINEDGTIADGNNTIQWLKSGTTRTWEDGVHSGTTGFSNLADGQYIIKEVKAPLGYQRNTADVMVLVTGDTIYANAGTEDDGVTVGRGPGYMVSTLERFASEGQIDNTLSWIYAQMQISGESKSFADVGDKSKTVGYLTANNSSSASKNETDAARTYLEYVSEKGNVVFNYVANTKRSKDMPGTQNPTETRRLFTTVGWPYYEIYQDYEYGEKVKNSAANYEDWSGNDLAHLFARTTYIRVTDIQRTELQVKKVSGVNENVTLSGAEFRLYRQKEGQQAEYYFKDKENQQACWSVDKEQALVAVTNEEGLSEETFTWLSDGIYYLEEIKAPDGYQLPSKPIKLKLYHAVMTLESPNPPNGHEVEGTLREDNSYLYTVTVPNFTGHELPAAGGHGTILYTIGGLLTMCASLLLLYRNKKRRREVL